MNVHNLIINVGEPSAFPHLDALIESLRRGDASAVMPLHNDTLSVPKIGEPWPGQGGIYAGVARGEDGQPDQHLVLAVEEPTDKLKWDAALSWAKRIEVESHHDFHVPTRSESALLYAHLRDQFDASAWYWTSTQLSDAACAWLQHFTSGIQYYDDKGCEARARAVRRFTA